MGEFEFLEKQFRRLSEARQLRARHERQILGKQKDACASAFETAELMMRGAIEDYLKMRKGDSQ